MEGPLEAIQKAVNSDIFIEYQEGTRLYQLGAIKSNFVRKRDNGLPNTWIKRFEDLGFEYLGDVKAKFIFRRECLNGKKPDNFKNLEDFFKARF